MTGLEKKVAAIVAGDLPVERKISQLTILALKAAPSSPNQKMIQAARAALKGAN